MMFATAASVYPYAVPPALTLTAAAAPTLTLTVMLILIGVLLPVMLIYNGYQYRVFRGKTPESRLRRLRGVRQDGTTVGRVFLGRGVVIRRHQKALFS